MLGAGAPILHPVTGVGTTADGIEPIAQHGQALEQMLFATPAAGSPDPFFFPRLPFC